MSRRVSRTRRLMLVLFLNLALITAQVAVGMAAHSLAVLAAGADYLADAAAIGVSLLAIWLAARPPTASCSTSRTCSCHMRNVTSMTPAEMSQPAA